MFGLVLKFYFAGLLAMCDFVSKPPKDLSVYHWKFRLVLIFEGKGQTLLKKQISKLDKDQLLERDVKVFRIPAGSHALREQFKIQPQSFAAVLVGKDGGEKLKLPKPLSQEKLNETIDAMPMRKREMKERG